MPEKEAIMAGGCIHTLAKADVFRKQQIQVFTFPTDAIKTCRDPVKRLLSAITQKPPALVYVPNAGTDAVSHIECMFIIIIILVNKLPLAARTQWRSNKQK